VRRPALDRIAAGASLPLAVATRGRCRAASASRKVTKRRRVFDELHPGSRARSPETTAMRAARELFELRLRHRRRPANSRDKVPHPAPAERHGRVGRRAPWRLPASPRPSRALPDGWSRTSRGASAFRAIVLFVCGGATTSNGCASCRDARRCGESSEQQAVPPRGAHAAISATPNSASTASASGFNSRALDKNDAQDAESFGRPAGSRRAAPAAAGSSASRRSCRARGARSAAR